MTSEAEEKHLQTALRAYGETVGRRPLKWCAVSFSICLAVALPGWLTRKPLGGSKDMLSPVDMDLQWAIEGGKTERNIKIWKERHGDGDDTDWVQKSHTTMFVGKGGREGHDILTHDALAEWIELDRKWTTLSVEVNNKTYTTWDICARGVLPDVPGAPIMPCLTVSPLHCFKEEGEVNHATYQAIDPVVGTVIPGAVPYSTRPALANLSDPQIKSALSAVPDPSLTGAPGSTRGCVGQTSAFLNFADLWGGQLEWQNGTITKAGALRGIYWMDAPARIAYRMSILKPSHAAVWEIKEAQRKHSALWQSVCEEQNHKNTVIEVANMEDWSYISEKLEDVSAKMNWWYLISGSVLMTIFCAFALVSLRHPMASRANVGFTGLLLVVISTFASFGLFFLVGKYLNTAIMLAVPLLALGLCLDDLFVLLRYFSGMGVDFIDTHSPSEILGEVMVRAGPGVMLTSVCNSLAFACGTMLPVPAMSDFCFVAAIVAAVNYFCSTNIFLPLLVNEARRVQTRQADPHFLTYFGQRAVMRQDERRAHRRGSQDAMSSADYTRHPEKRLIQWLTQSYAPFLMKPAVNISLALLAVGCLVASCVLINGKSVGFAPAELFEKSDPNFRSVDLLFKRFAAFPSWLCFFDMEIPEKQVEMLQLYKDIGNTELAMYGSAPPYLSMLYKNMLVYNVSARAMYPAGTEPATIVQSAGFDMSWTDPFLAPFGTLTKDPATFYDKFFNPWRQFPADPLGAWDMGQQAFMYADLAGVNEFRRAEYTESGTQKLSFSFFPVYRIGLVNEDKFVEAIKQTNEIIDASSIKDNAFIYGTVSTYWEVFLELDAHVWTLFGIDAGIIFVVALLIFSFDVVTAFITCVACSMIVLEIYGLACAFMSFNIFVAAISLMSMGLSVEFTAHLAAAFSLEKGPSSDRLGAAMAHTFPALVEGSLSTLLSILPMAFHPALFTVKYLFGIIAMVVGVGVINGFILMPALLALFSPLIVRRNRARGAAPKAAVEGCEHVSSPAALGDREEPDASDPAKLPTMLTDTEVHKASAEKAGTEAVDEDVLVKLRI